MPLRIGRKQHHLLLPVRDNRHLRKRPGDRHLRVRHLHPPHGPAIIVLLPQLRRRRHPGAVHAPRHGSQPPASGPALRIRRRRASRNPAPVAIPLVRLHLPPLRPVLCPRAIYQSRNRRLPRRISRRVSSSSSSGRRRPAAKLGRQQQAAAPVVAAADEVDEKAGGLAAAPALLLLALDDEAVDAALQAVLVAREGVEAEAEQALAVALADGVRDEVAQERGAVVRLRVRVWTRERASREASEEGGSQVFEVVFCLLAI
ncbi:hypothetical protein VTK56DRAFT_5165 [Thermocarpiscus australiensis]